MLIDQVFSVTKLGPRQGAAEVVAEPAPTPPPAQPPPPPTAKAERYVEEIAMK